MPRCCFQCPRWQLSQWKNEGGRLLSREPSTTQWMRASCLDLCDDSDDSCLPRSLQGSTSWKELHAETHSIVRETFSRIEGLKLFNALGSAACLPCFVWHCLATVALQQLHSHMRTISLQFSTVSNCRLLKQGAIAANKGLRGP